MLRRRGAENERELCHHFNRRSQILLCEEKGKDVRLGVSALIFGLM